MKKIILKTVTSAIMATTIGSNSPTKAMESFNFDKEKVMPIAVTVAATGVVCYGIYWLFGKEKPVAATSDITQSQLKQEILDALTPVKSELSLLKAQQTEILEIIKSSEPTKSTLTKLLQDLLGEQKLNGHKDGTSLQSSFLSDLSAVKREDEGNGDGYVTPRKKIHVETEVYKPSPKKKLSEKELNGPFSTLQTKLKPRVLKKQLRGDIWDILKDDGSKRAQALCTAIMEVSDEKASFDLIVKTESVDKLVIVLNGDRSFKLINH